MLRAATRSSPRNAAELKSNAKVTLTKENNYASLGCKLQIKFNGEQQLDSFSEKHKISLSSYSQLLPSGFPSLTKYKVNRHTTKLKKLRKDIADFESTLPQVNDCSLLEIKSQEQNFCKLMSSVQMLCKEEGEDVPTGEIRKLVFCFLDFLFRCHSTCYPWDVAVLENKKIIEELKLNVTAYKYSQSPRMKRKLSGASVPCGLSEWRKEMIKTRDTIVNQIAQTFREIVGWHRKSLSFLIQPVERCILAPNYNSIFMLYRKENLELDELLENKFGEFATLTPAHLGVKQNLWLIPSQLELEIDCMEAPYYSAIMQLRSLSSAQTPWEKLSTLKDMVSAMHVSILKYHHKYLLPDNIDLGSMAIGAEELLPLMMYIVVQSRIKYLASECNFMEDFLPESQMARGRAYYLVSFRTVLTAIENFTLLT